jgi:RNA polymerase sigma-70 factor, ECF subfamily
MPADADNQAQDLRLMQAIATGDPEAIARLYDRFGALVYRMAYQVLPSKQEAEDAVQEVFIRLWRTSDRYDPSRAALVTWVMLLSRRYLVDRLRRNKSSLRAGTFDDKISEVASGERQGVSPGRSGSNDGQSSSQKLEDKERFATLMKRIDKLPELQKTVVVRAYLNGQTLRQIAIELNTPLGTVKSALSRALVRLRETDVSEGLSA